MRIANRIDYQIIADLIESGSSVLDLGCGNGRLLEILIKEKNVQGVGIEKDHSMVKKSLEKGIPVIQANLDGGLSEYPDKSFDFVVLSLTLQALKKPDLVISEMLRIGKKAIVSFPNFGHFLLRYSILFKGKMPKSKFLPFEWYNTPNIHFCSINDFKEFCKANKIKIVKKIFLKNFNKIIKEFLPNIFASIGIFVLETEN
ncbi:MAG TPA: methionine biosynthesis protein MetW [Spirochaetia bacterium]|nr:MAG: methionine biosynthesis protein MetW [Spirochaetes bacterium GWB1_36_13]HCL57794.1 methionine biosynthesis protein MetW [Spirochaetia bacterium]